MASVELNFLKRGGALGVGFCGPVRVHFSTLEVRGVVLNFMMSKSGAPQTLARDRVEGLTLTLARTPPPPLTRTPYPYP